VDGLLGKTIAHYEVRSVLGSGGMGVVYGARDTKLDRDVALKVLPEELAADDERVQRFKREARVLAALNHPNIASIYGIEDAPPATPVLILERVDGESLASRLRQGPLEIRDALRVSRSIALALESAHERGIIHRDLKPGNVMVSAAGIVKVLDFGLARWAPKGVGSGEDPTAEVSLTQPGRAAGTPGYMSPEQILGAEQDERTDVFALGCILYELVAGTRAFPGRTAPEAMAAALRGEPNWDALPAQAPAPLRALIRQCLEKDPGSRLAAVRGAREAIESLLEGASWVAADSGPAAPVPNNLPVQLTSFVGRSRELEECSGHLDRSRLLTLTGVGGSGKSRLMLRLAERRMGKCPGGVWYVDLAPISDPARAADLLADVLGLREVSGESLLGIVVTHLCDRHALVLFDNCEHVLLPMAELIRTLLKACPRLQILATSREALRVEGEQSYPVAPLSLPDPSLGGEAAGRSEAVRLFVERAALVRTGFALDRDTAPVVAEICRRLDGIPLALELAAARLRALSIQDIRARLDDRFRLLTGGSRHALPRHQTLRATIQWSYDHLSPEEQRAFRALAVFAGGWTLEAALAVMGPDHDEFAMLDLLTALAEKSLIHVDWTPAGESRYRFLETVRQYALEVLREANEIVEYRDAHLRYVLAAVERIEPQLTGPAQETWFRRLHDDHENVLAALAWSEDADGGGPTGLRIAGSLWRFWWYEGRFTPGLALLQRALAREGAAAPTPERAQALYGAAQMARELGDYPKARDLFLQSLDVAQSLGDPARIARAYNGLGNTAEYAGDLDAASDYHRKSLELSRQIGNERGIAIDLHNLAIVLMLKTDYAGARPLFEEALAIFRAIGDVNADQATVTNLAIIATRTGALAEARGHFRESFRLAEELSSQMVITDSLESLAEFAVEVGASDLAARVLGTAAVAREATGYALSVDARLAVEGAAKRARAALGERRYVQLEAEGRTMSFGDAVHRVREWLAERPAMG
jgi:predicted ATPase/serine/threonine protein kinase